MGEGRRNKQKVGSICFQFLGFSQIFALTCEIYHFHLIKWNQFTKYRQEMNADKLQIAQLHMKLDKRPN